MKLPNILTQLKPITSEETTILGTYNSESARGLIHSTNWNHEMAELQFRFNTFGFYDEKGELHPA